MVHLNNKNSWRKESEDRAEEEEGEEETGEADLEPLGGGGGGGARHDVLAAGELHRLGLGGALSSQPHVAPILPPPPPLPLPSA
uniref:Uncharacterized protein n=1 Tax=Oryza meridionalis TaxID=40149 RepID=A0A0E0EY03_9ORYZ